MNFFPEIEATEKWRRAGRLSFVSLTALSFLMQCGPALAEKVEQTISVKPVRPPDQFLLGLFTVLNYVAGIAIIAAVVCSLIWFLQKRNEPDVDTVDNEAAAETEAAAEAKADEKKAEEKKPDETKSEESKSEESKTEETKSESDKKED